MLRRLPSRRELLTRTSCGFGAVALHALLADAAVVQDEKFGLRDTVSEQRPMFAPRVKRIILSLCKAVQVTSILSTISRNLSAVTDSQSTSPVCDSGISVRKLSRN